MNDVVWNGRRAFVEQRPKVKKREEAYVLVDRASGYDIASAPVTLVGLESLIETAIHSEDLHPEEAR